MISTYSILSADQGKIRGEKQNLEDLYARFADPDPGNEPAPAAATAPVRRPADILRGFAAMFLRGRFSSLER
ncbi:MAG: hypothetical protein WAU86_00740 [Oricola sp.]